MSSEYCRTSHCPLCGGLCRQRIGSQFVFCTTCMTDCQAAMKWLERRNTMAMAMQLARVHAIFPQQRQQQHQQQQQRQRRLLPRPPQIMMLPARAQQDGNVLANVQRRKIDERATKRLLRSGGHNVSTSSSRHGDLSSSEKSTECADVLSSAVHADDLSSPMHDAVTAPTDGPSVSLSSTGLDVSSSAHVPVVSYQPVAARSSSSRYGFLVGTAPPKIGPSFSASAIHPGVATKSTVHDRVATHESTNYVGSSSSPIDAAIATSTVHPPANDWRTLATSKQYARLDQSYKESYPTKSARVHPDNESVVQTRSSIDKNTATGKQLQRRKEEAKESEQQLGGTVPTMHKSARASSKRERASHHRASMQQSHPSTNYVGGSSSSSASTVHPPVNDWRILATSKRYALLDQSYKESYPAISAPAHQDDESVVQTRSRIDKTMATGKRLQRRKEEARESEQQLGGTVYKRARASSKRARVSHHRASMQQSKWDAKFRAINDPLFQTLFKGCPHHPFGTKVASWRQKVKLSKEKIQQNLIAMGVNIK